MSKVYAYETTNGATWTEFISAMSSGLPVEIDSEMWFYWLEVIPPVHMRYDAILPEGRTVRASFGFAEGVDNVVAFWHNDGRRYCCRTDEIAKGH